MSRSIIRSLLAAGSLGVLIMPIAAGASTATTTISSVVGTTITLFTTSGTVNANVTPTASGVQTLASDTVTVGTNDAAGYTLTLQDSDANTNLVSGGNNIAASAGTQTTPTAETANMWGYRVDSIGGFGAGPTSGASNAAISGTIKFAGVPATGSPNTIKTTGSASASDVTTVWYGVTADTTKPSGTYTDQVTYTATAN